jgi:hypothetical protein
MNEPWRLSASELAEDIPARKVSAREAARRHSVPLSPTRARGGARGKPLMCAVPTSPACGPRRGGEGARAERCARVSSLRSRSGESRGEAFVLSTLPATDRSIDIAMASIDTT